MDPTPHLTDLLRLARRQRRLRRARHWMMSATFGISALALAATRLDQPDAALFLLPLVPLAGGAGYLRRRGSDAAIAQILDEQLKTRELLASGVACLGKSDAGSAMILAQAEASAAATDRNALGLWNGPSRSEVAAGLVLAIAISVSVGVGRPDRLRTEAVRMVDARADATQRTPAPSNHEVEPMASRRNQSDPLEENQPSDRASNGATSETVRRPAGDASGDGQAITPSNAPSAIPPARGSLASSPQGEHTGLGQTSAETSVDGRTNILSSALARRVPGGADVTFRPTETARQDARRALDAERIDIDSRDLVRAYFELDEGR